MNTLHVSALIIVLYKLFFFSSTAPYAVITYHLISSSPGSGHDLFKVDANTGLVLTKSFLSESTKGCYDLLIEARNPDEPLLNDNATVDICVTDQNQSPLFSQAYYNFSIDENLPSGILKKYMHTLMYIVIIDEHIHRLNFLLYIIIYRLCIGCCVSY